MECGFNKFFSSLIKKMDLKEQFYKGHISAICCEINDYRTVIVTFSDNTVIDLKEIAGADQGYYVDLFSRLQLNRKLELMTKIAES